MSTQTVGITGFKLSQEEILGDAKEMPKKSTRRPWLMHVEAIKVLRERGYTYKEISKFLADRGVHVSDHALIQGMNALNGKERIKKVKK